MDTELVRVDLVPTDIIALRTQQLATVLIAHGRVLITDETMEAIDGEPFDDALLLSILTKVDGEGIMTAWYDLAKNSAILRWDRQPCVES